MTDENLKHLRTFFSIREYDQLDKLLLVYFIYENTISALLIIASSGLFSAGSIEIPDYLEQVSRNCGEIIYQIREKKFQKYISDQETISFGSSEDLIDRSMKIVHKGKSILLFLISVKDVINSIHSNNNEIESIRIRQDLYQILSAMISDSGFLTLLNVSTLAVLFSGSSHHDENLIFHQISLSMSDIYEIDFDISSCISGVLNNPSDKDDIFQFLKDKV